MANIYCIAGYNILRNYGFSEGKSESNKEEYKKWSNRSDNLL